MDRLERLRDAVLEHLYTLTELRYRRVDQEALAELPLDEQHKAMYAQGAMDALELLLFLARAEERGPGAQ